MYQGHSEQIFGPTSYAQHGDDLFILNCFQLLGIAKPTYLDLGAHHPVDISNTALLYARGSRGVNVEANPVLFQAFLDQRPEDLNLNCAVGNVSEPVMKEFYIHDFASGLNTFSRSEVSWVSQNSLMLRMVSIHEILRQCPQGKFPDFLNTDLEGLDFEVLESCPFTEENRPSLIACEVRPHEAHGFVQMMRHKGYEPIMRIIANLFFVPHSKKELFVS